MQIIMIPTVLLLYCFKCCVNKVFSTFPTFFNSAVGVLKVSFDLAFEEGTQGHHYGLGQVFSTRREFGAIYR